jgi:hypothetical protein
MEKVKGDVRKYQIIHGVSSEQIEEEMQLAAGDFERLLANDLSPEEKEKIFFVILGIAHKNHERLLQASKEKFIKEVREAQVRFGISSKLIENSKGLSEGEFERLLEKNLTCDAQSDLINFIGQLWLWKTSDKCLEGEKNVERNERRLERIRQFETLLSQKGVED